MLYGKIQKEGVLIDTNLLLNDAEFAKSMLEKKNLNNADLVFVLRNLLKMKYYPVAVKFFFSEKELESFKKEAVYRVGINPLTVSHLVAGARQKGVALLGTIGAPLLIRILLNRR